VCVASSYLFEKRRGGAEPDYAARERNAVMATLLLLILILLLIGAVPAWPYNTGWGYYPSGGIGLVVLIVVLMAVFGMIPWNF
jgi:hypothetical protein